MKATAVAPSNIAFIKYWGKKDEALRLPLNGSVSMNLSNLLTTTTVEFNKNFKKDIIIIDGKRDLKEEGRVINHLNRIRKIAKIKLKAKVVSQNNFPKSSGLASSASGFAALTLAATKAAGLNLSQKQLSILARQGSGSACRSIPDGFVEWLKGEDNETSYAYSLFPPSYWKIIDVVVIVVKEEKKIKSSQGQKIVLKNPFLKTRLFYIKEKIKKIKQFIAKKDFPQFGELLENEALEFHAIALTSNPPIIYWQPETLKIVHLVREWRNHGLLVYFTIDAGPNLHLFCEEKNQQFLMKKLKFVKEVKKIIVNYPSEGARITDKHLF